MTNKKLKVYLQDEIDQIQNSIEHSKKVLEQVQEQKFFKDRELEQKKKILAQRIKDLEESKIEIQDQNQQNNDFSVHLKDLESKLIDLNFRHKKALEKERQIQNRKQELKNLINEMNESLFKRNSLEFKIADKEKLEIIVGKNIFNEQKKLVEVRIQVKKLEKQLSEKTKKIQGWVKTSTFVAESLKKNQKTSEILIGKIQEKKDFLEKAIKVQSELELKNKKLSENNQNLSSKLNKLRKDFDSFDTDNTAIQKENTILSSSIEESKKEIQQLILANKKASKEAQRVQIKKKKLLSTHSKSEEQVEELKKELKSKISILTNMKQGIEELGSEGQRLTNEIHSLKEDLKLKSQQISKLKISYKQLQRQYQSESRTINNLKKKQETIKNQKQSLNNGINDIKDRLSTIVSSIENKNETAQKEEITIHQLIANPINSKHISDLTKEDTHLKLIWDVLVEQMIEHTLFAKKIEIIPHLKCYEIRIQDFFDSVEKIDRIFSNFKNMVKGSDIQFGHKIISNNDQNDLAFILKKPEVNKNTNLGGHL